MGNSESSDGGGDSYTTDDGIYVPPDHVAANRDSGYDWGDSMLTSNSTGETVRASDLYSSSSSSSSSASFYREESAATREFAVGAKASPCEGFGLLAGINVANLDRVVTHATTGEHMAAPSVAASAKADIGQNVSISATAPLTGSGASYGTVDVHGAGGRASVTAASTGDVEATVDVGGRGGGPHASATVGSSGSSVSFSHPVGPSTSASIRTTDDGVIGAGLSYHSHRGEKTAGVNVESDGRTVAVGVNVQTIW